MRLHLIDGSGYIYRAFYGLPPLTKSDGTPVGAVYGYCEMLWRLLGHGGFTHIAVIMDGGRSGRQEIDPAYKANRAPRPPELVRQIDEVARATAAFGVSCIRMPGYEADDVIATYARTVASAGHEVTIYSSDKDLLPLLSHRGVGIYDPMKKQIVTAEICEQRMGVAPHQVADLLALVGDASDNIPGVPSIGEKTAAAMLRAHGSLDDILRMAASNPMAISGCKTAQRNALVANIDAARLSRKLVELQTIEDLPDLAAAKFFQVNREPLLQYLRGMEFNVMAHTVGQHFGMAA